MLGLQSRIRVRNLKANPHILWLTQAILYADHETCVDRIRKLHKHMLHINLHQKCR